MCLIAVRREEYRRSIVGDLLPAIDLRFLHGNVGSHLAGLVAQDTQLAGREVIEEVHIYHAFALLVGGGEKAARLGIALRAHRVGDLPAVEIDHGDVVTGICLELADAGDADVRAAIIDDRAARAHSGVLGVIGIVIELDVPEITELAVLRNGNAVEVAALRGEVGAAVMIGHAAARVARMREPDRADELAGPGIERENARIAARIAGIAVIRRDENIAVRHIRAGPVETAKALVLPGGNLCLVASRRILVRHGQAHEVCIELFALPKAGVDIAVMVVDRAVWLTAERVAVDPERLERLGIERLHAAVREADEDHAFGIRRAVDGKGRFVIHLPLALDLAGHNVQLIDHVLGVSIEIVPHEDRAAAGVGTVALAELRCPVEHRVLRRGGRFHVYDAVIVFVRTERRPHLGHRRIRALRRFFQRHSNRCRLLRYGIGLFLHTDVPVPGHGIAEARPRREQRRAVLVRINAAAGVVVDEEHVGVGWRHVKRDRHRLLLDEVKVIDRRDGVRIAVQHLERNGLLGLIRIERHGNAVKRLEALAADARGIIARGRVRCRRSEGRGRVGDLHIVVGHIAAEGDTAAGGIGERERFAVGGDSKTLKMQTADKLERIVLIVRGLAARFGRAQRHRAGNAADLEEAIEARYTAVADGVSDDRFLDAVDFAGGRHDIIINGRHGVAACRRRLRKHAADRIGDHVAHTVRTGRERCFGCKLLFGGVHVVIERCGGDCVRR